MTFAAVRGGAVAGIVAGIVIAVWVMSIGAALGDDLSVAMKTAAYPMLGPRVLLPGFDATALLLGLISHVAVSLVWGVMFAFVAFGLARAGTVWAGLLWGIVVWIGMFYVVLPLTDAGVITQRTPIARAVVEHLVFGLAVGVAFLPYQHPQLSPALGSRARETTTPGVR